MVTTALVQQRVTESRLKAIFLCKKSLPSNCVYCASDIRCQVLEKKKINYKLCMMFCPTLVDGFDQQKTFCWAKCYFRRCLLATTGRGSSKAGGARKACDPSPSGAQAPQHSPNHLR